ncbi:MAG: 50S ribosomal protein L24 [Candidatus Moranbacteria bacterium GW2011_GWF2_34_56]|nr:MAG: 50S ribosomal protein L24 [Candidatus Moranbacteria bacterium GW2011_GWF1_34_10]KKP65248.1 MAG: 50S ribosomal protein L24 [Candidatus Moranbacteria bacterium GW2011_GWF2_34_56]HBI17497.1 50S ribosomal protein L24 [Candidatus Moranbacteria bacterium]
MRIKKDDKVKIIAGKDSGKSGKVLRVIRSVGKVTVEGMNIIKKHVRPKKDGEKGQRVEIAVPMDVSNVMLVCPNCKKETRVGYAIDKDGKKNRVCKKCKKNI